MGLIIHDAIIVTSFKSEHASAAWTFATQECELVATPLTVSPMNGYSSFLIVPDGSKEGWADSDKGEAARAKWIEWARGCYARGVYLDWAVVRYGSELQTGARVTDSNTRDPEDE